MSHVHASQSLFLVETSQTIVCTHTCRCVKSCNVCLGGDLCVCVVYALGLLNNVCQHGDAVTFCRYEHTKFVLCQGYSQECQESGHTTRYAGGACTHTHVASIHVYMYVVPVRNSCKTLIGVHEMHGQMHPN